MNISNSSNNESNNGSYSNSDHLLDAKEIVNKLSAEERTELIKEMYKEMEMPINAGGQVFLHADLVIQVNSLDSSIEQLFRAAATRISKNN
jgi:hypothetical protein